MTRRSSRGLLLAVLFAALAAGCTPTLRLSEDIAAYETDIERLERRLIADPGDAEALRDLGVIYLRARRYTEGAGYLEQAFARDTTDAKTLFYLGLANEMLGRTETALRLYAQDVPRLSSYRRLMRGRAEQLRRTEARRQVVQLLAEERVRAEGGGQAAQTSPRIVAVFPLTLTGGPDRYAPLGRGLSEMVTTDLANVSSLRLVERVRLQALLDELELAQSEYVDPSTAPRSGRLLGAGRLVGGSFAVQDGDLNVDVAVVSAEDAFSRSLDATAGDLDDLFDLEKQLVFKLIDELGVELTPAEREAIERVPTRNLQAFLAYSRGLEAEDAGNFDAAADAFRQAGELDPGFEGAVERAETAEGMAVTGGSVEEVLAAAAALEPPPTRSVDLVQNRLQLLNATLTGLFVPGEDTRKPAQEGVAPLTDPPPPPGGR